MSHVKYATALRLIPDCLSGRIYTLFSFQLHANACALHEYSLEEKKNAERGEGPGFDELNNFQPPKLSSWSKLVSILLFGLPQYL